MTTAPGHSVLPHTTQNAAPVAHTGPRPFTSAIRVEWVIAIEALRAARPDLTYSPSIGPHARAALLTWTISPGGEANATIDVDGEPLDFTLVPPGLGADVTVDETTRTLHIRVPGLLELVLDRSSDEHDATGAGRLLYARSSLLSAIGLPGGSYRLTQPRAGQ